MPLTVARHCSRVEKPQFLPPPSSAPPYWAHYGYSVPACTGVTRVGRDAIAAIPITAIKRICSSPLDKPRKQKSPPRLAISWPQSFIN